MNEHNMNDPLDLDGLDQLFGDDISMPSAADYMAPTSSTKQRDLSFFHHIPVKVTLEVASTEVALGELMKVEEGPSSSWTSWRASRWMSASTGACWPGARWWWSTANTGCGWWTSWTPNCWAA